MSLEIKGQVVKIMEPVTGVSKSTGKDWKVEPVNGGTAPNPVNEAMNTPPAPTDDSNLPF